MINDNDRNDTYISDTLYNGDVSSWNGLLNIQNISQDNESSNLNEINITVDNVDVNGYYCYINSTNGSESKNHSSVDYTYDIVETSTIRYVMENDGLPYCVGVGSLLPASTLNQYSNIEYNNEHHNLLINGNILASKKSSVSSLTTWIFNLVESV